MSLNATPLFEGESWSPPSNPAVAAGWDGGGLEVQKRKGFFTDTSICIGCKACEVACKEWNDVPEDGIKLLGRSYDNTGHLGASTWRHVAFIEQRTQSTQSSASVLQEAQGTVQAGQGTLGGAQTRWLMASDVCKHCTSAACLEVCPTGALFRTEFSTVVVQQDVCNGCGYCVVACPFGVIEQRPQDGRVWKCTLCYDRLKGGLVPACAKACPTESIQFGDLDELRQRASDRLGVLKEAGISKARLYGESPADGVGGFGAFFLLLDEPEVYGLPPDPTSSTVHARATWRSAAIAAVGIVLSVGATFARSNR